MVKIKKGKTKRTGAPKPAPESSKVTDVPAIIEKAHVLLAQSNFELAIKFLERALALDGANLEARELLGVAELEGGDVDAGRQHLLLLFPPHAPAQPSSPSPYLYLAQTAGDPHEALGYYTTAVAMVENALGAGGKGKGRQAAAEGAPEAGEEELRKMAVTALVAMVEIWMSDLCFEPQASANCDALVAHALQVAPGDLEALMTLASVRMSQSRFEEAKDTVLRIYADLEGRDPFDPMLPELPARLQFARLLLEHHLYLEALDVLSTAREEDSLEVEAAYLEGWAWFLRGEAVLEDPALLQKGAEEEEEPAGADECFAEAFRCLLECAKLFTEQEYPDEGIGGHVQELIGALEARGVQPAVAEEKPDAEGAEGEGEEGEWEDVDGGDVRMG